MSIIESLTEYIKLCPHLAALAALTVDEVQPGAPGYCLVPMPGTRIVSTDILGNRRMDYPFALMSRAITVDDYARIENAGLSENFADWLQAQTDEENFPELGEKREPTAIEATSWGYLYQREEDAQTGIYQIICRLAYTQLKGE
jgi:hypothetical protein